MTEPAVAQALTIDVERKGEAALVKVHGRLVAGLSDLLYAQVKPLFPDTKRVIVDLADLTFMDSIGLGTLVRLYVSAKSSGSSLELMNIGKRIRQVLGITHLLDVFTIVGERGITMRF
ncbi:MAG TPA: STAS domain-containing protein [Acidobacteriaceae bacterium]|jgi:anti-sigma B factor antagonist|nr:STAS domain-containing protein [Acidobacteriaceae bacterium]